MRFNPGDSVEYTRHTDGTPVRGVVAEVCTNSSLFHSQLAEEAVAYRLVLSAGDAARIGHPVTIGHSRVRA